ncbi:MFS transporter [Rhodopila sp.]|uniref:MFS transporter n=1 Tax=Rhodopila sp. TaxID=2480087 RepID=UPI003D121A75
MSGQVETAAGLGALDRPSTMRHVLWASMIGTVIEWYDFLIYGTAAALVFNKLFFPSFDPATGTLAAFGTYAVGFIARPLGGTLFGHFGDRLGRKTMLMLTLLITGGGTVLIGCLPTYGQLGFAAPVLLVVLRFVQGIGLGGEWGGAVLMVVEHAPANRRGLYGSLVQIGFPIGVAASTGIFIPLSAMPAEAFLSWGWRIPFLVSILLVAVGLFVRMRLSETPAFQRARQADTLARRPAWEVITQTPRVFLIAVGMKISEVAWVYVLTVFAIVYATTRLGLPRPLILNGIIAGALLELITLPLAGWLSDRFGRKPIYLAGVGLSIAAAFPVFWLLDTRDPLVVVAGLALVMNLTHAIGFGIGAAWMPELFGTRVRYTGASLGCQVSAAISGGFAPIIATALLGWAGATWPVSLYLVVLGLVAAIAVLAAKETHRDGIDGEGAFGPVGQGASGSIDQSTLRLP